MTTPPSRRSVRQRASLIFSKARVASPGSSGMNRISSAPERSARFIRPAERAVSTASRLGRGELSDCLWRKLRAASSLPLIITKVASGGAATFSDRFAAVAVSPSMISS